MGMVWGKILAIRRLDRFGFFKGPGPGRTQSPKKTWAGAKKKKATQGPNSVGGRLRSPAVPQKIRAIQRFGCLCGKPWCWARGAGALYCISGRARGKRTTKIIPAPAPRIGRGGGAHLFWLGQRRAVFEVGILGFFWGKKKGAKTNGGLRGMSPRPASFETHSRRGQNGDVREEERRKAEAHGSPGTGPHFPRGPKSKRRIRGLFCLNFLREDALADISGGERRGLKAKGARRKGPKILFASRAGAGSPGAGVRDYPALEMRGPKGPKGGPGPQPTVGRGPRRFKGRQAGHGVDFFLGRGICSGPRAGGKPGGRGAGMAYGLDSNGDPIVEILGCGPACRCRRALPQHLLGGASRPGFYVLGFPPRGGSAIGTSERTRGKREGGTRNRGGPAW